MFAIDDQLPAWAKDQLAGVNERLLTLGAITCPHCGASDDRSHHIGVSVTHDGACTRTAGEVVVPL